MRISFALIVLILIQTCITKQPQATVEETHLMLTAMEKMGKEYSKPRLVYGEMVINIDEIRAWSKDSVAAFRSLHAIPEDAEPIMQIWSASIKDHWTQRLLAPTTLETEPSLAYTEPMYGNRILYWELPDSTLNTYPIRLKKTFKYLTFDYRPRINEWVEGANWSEIPGDISKKYTRSETFLEQDQALIDTVHSILLGISNPVQKARKIYDWVQATMTYVYPPHERGVRDAFDSREGDCGQYTALFITMARIAGIPARQQSGFNFYPGNTGAHVWSQIYLPIKGWVPVDATREDGFLHLDNGRIITSVGLNIPLEPVPEWASFAFSEVEDDRTDFMQMYTLLNFGLSARISTERTIIRSIELD
ncbi:MAG: transglutaminase-like domain-containing protein [Candidatus Marinimicrobia bacterium]|nr:transglutaminase-like domain-containing protein [Candidatus Neomarinimicrobiota bacterium]